MGGGKNDPSPLSHHQVEANDVAISQRTVTGEIEEDVGELMDILFKPGNVINVADGSSNNVSGERLKPQPSHQAFEGTFSSFRQSPPPTPNIQSSLQWQNPRDQGSCLGKINNGTMYMNSQDQPYIPPTRTSGEAGFSQPLGAYYFFPPLHHNTPSQHVTNPPTNDFLGSRMPSKSRKRALQKLDGYNNQQNQNYISSPFPQFHPGPPGTIATVYGTAPLLTTISDPSHFHNHMQNAYGHIAFSASVPIQPSQYKRYKSADRFFWTDELHHRFLQCIFKIGLREKNEDEILQTLTTGKPDSAIHMYHNVEEVTLALQLLLDSEDQVVREFTKQVKLACSQATECITINERKGGQPTFHVYPFSISQYEANSPIASILELDNRLDVTFCHRFLAAIFDVGMRYARPKTLFNMMQPCPETMTSSSIKSHIQKYRANSQQTRVLFLHQFGPNEACRTDSFDLYTSPAALSGSASE